MIGLRHKTGNHVCCVNFPGIHQATFSPAMQLTINYSLTLASSKRIYRQPRFMVVTGIWSRILLWNALWEMVKVPIIKLRDFLWCREREQPRISALMPETWFDGGDQKKHQRFGATVMVALVLWTMWMYPGGGIDYGNTSIFQLKCKWVFRVWDTSRI